MNAEEEWQRCKRLAEEQAQTQDETREETDSERDDQTVGCRPSGPGEGEDPGGGEGGGGQGRGTGGSQRRRRGAPSLLRGQTRLTSFATPTTTHDGQHSTRARASKWSVRAHEHARTHTAGTASITFSPAAVEVRDLVCRVHPGKGPVGATGHAGAAPAQGGASRAQLRADGGRKADDPREASQAKPESRREEGRRPACGTVRRRGCAQWRPPGRRFRLPTAAPTRRRHAARRLERDGGGWTALLTVCMCLSLVLVLH